MKELLLIRNEEPANRVSYYLLLLLLVSFPFDMFYSHLVLICFGVHTLIHLQKTRLREVFTSRTIILQSVFWVTVVSTIYTSDFGGAGTQLGKHVPILLFPVLFSVSNLDIHKYLPKLLTAFAYTCVATVIYLYSTAFIALRHYHLPLKLIFSEAFVNHNFSAPIKMHATFFSMQLVIALMWLVMKFKADLSAKTKWFYIACGLTLIAGLVQLCSKSILATVMLIALVVVPVYLIKAKIRKQYIIGSIAATLILIGAITQLKSFKEHYLIGLRDDLSTEHYRSIADSRVSRWNVIGGLIAERPLTGYGAGTEIPLLHEAFYQHKLYNSFLAGLNAHSQYLSFLLKSGIWGLAIYIATLAFGFRIALREKNVMLLCFMLVIGVVSLSEDLLDVDKGVMFYALFFTLLTAPKRTKKVTQTSDKNLAPVATEKELEPSLY